MLAMFFSLCLFPISIKFFTFISFLVPLPVAIQLILVSSKYPKNHWSVDFYGKKIWHLFLIQKTFEELLFMLVFF